MTLGNTFRAAIVALALGGTALAAVPAQAASPTFGFSLNFGTPHNGIVLHFGDHNYFDYCLTNSQIRSALRHKGYYDVRIVKEFNKTDKVWAVGRKGFSWYQMRVDRCTGKVDHVRKIDRHSNGTFTLNFTF